MRTIATLLLASVIFGTSFAHARLIHSLEYDELMAKSDLVVLAVPFKGTVTQDIFPGCPPAKSSDVYDAFNTDFKILHVLKGDGAAPKDITVLHFLYTRRPHTTGAAAGEDGCAFVKFLGEGAPKDFDPGHFLPPPLSGQNTVWLAFLRRRPDGRYEAVAGQVDSSTSFRALKWQRYDLSDAPGVQDVTSRKPRKRSVHATPSPGLSK